MQKVNGKNTNHFQAMENVSEYVGEMIGADGLFISPHELSHSTNGVLTAAVNYSPHFMYMIDRDDRVLALNKPAAELFKVKPQEIIGKTIYDLFPPDIAENFSRDLKTVFKTGKSGIYNASLKANGSELYISAHLNPIKDNEGNVIAVLGVSRDITELKKLEDEKKKAILSAKRAIARTEKKYQSLVNNAVEGIYRITLNGDFLEINPSLAKMLGYDSIKEVKALGNVAKTYVDHKERKHFLDTLLEKGEVKNFEIRYKRKNGEILIAAEFARLITVDNLRIIEGTIHDITQRKIAEEALKKSEEKYRGLIENLNVGVYRNTPGKRGKFIEVNPALVAMFGYKDKKDFLKSKVSELYLKPTDRENFNKKMLKEGFVKNEEILLKKRDGTPFWGSVTAIAALDNNRNVIHYDGIIEDITIQKEIENELKIERRQLISLFEGINEPIYVSDPETYDLLFVNNALTKSFGNNLVGKKCYQALQGRSKPCVFCTNKKIIGKNFGNTHIWEWQNLKNKKWYRCVDRGIRWPNGKQVRFEIAFDITERKEAEEKMRRALEEEREFKLKIAHYFLNPICIAKGYLDLALGKTGKMDEIERALKALNRVENVIKNVTLRGEVCE